MKHDHNDIIMKSPGAYFFIFFTSNHKHRQKQSMKMVKSKSYSLFSFFSCFLAFILLNPSSSLANHASELVNEVCSKTSNYTFCVESLYSDPHTPESDSYGLAIIAFRLAYINATSTRSQILKLLKNASSSNSSTRRNLQRCARDYHKAVSAIETAYNDLNSETFFELADLAGVASRSADDCQATFKGTHNSPFTSLNKALKGLCEICTVISKRFTGS